MDTRPLDTDTQSWELRQDIVRRLTGEERLRIAFDLSDVVREIHLAGLHARNASVGEPARVRQFVRDAHRVTLPSAR